MDVTALCLPEERLIAIEDFLREHYGIQCFPDPEQLEEQIANNSGMYFELLRQKRASKAPVNAFQVDREFYNAISDHPLLGLIYSMKYNAIYDTIALAEARRRQIQPDS